MKLASLQTVCTLLHLSCYLSEKTGIKSLSEASSSDTHWMHALSAALSRTTPKDFQTRVNIDILRRTLLTGSSNSRNTERTCANNHPDCSEWAASGRCHINHGYMRSNCQRACELCTREECRDGHNDCRFWWSIGECDANPVWMKANCKKSCNVCHDGSCTNYDDFCEAWASGGECLSNPDFMNLYCPKACAVCKPEELTFGDDDNTPSSTPDKQAVIPWPMTPADCQSMNALALASGSSTFQNHEKCGWPGYYKKQIKLHPSPLYRLLMRMHDRIVGGTFSGLRQWPWHAIVGPKYRVSVCGGALINRQWVVTAAHCVAIKSKHYNVFGTAPNLKPCQWNVRLGTPKHAYLPDSGVIDVDVEKVFYHKNYAFTNIAENDIALLKLDHPVTLTDRIKPACVPNKSLKLDDGETVHVMGYGQNNVQSYDDIQDGGGENDYYMRHLELKATQCPSLGDKDQYVCTKSGLYGQSPCKGDSGGSAVVERDGRFMIVGVASAVADCGSNPNSLNYYTSITYFLEWINGVIEKN